MTTPEIKKELDNFWIDEPSILFRMDRLIEFFPTRDQTVNERLNALTRLGIYVSTILVMYNHNWKFVLISFITLFITYFIYISSSDTIKTKEDLDVHPLLDKPDLENGDGDFTLPTKKNPYMNRLLFDDPQKPPAPNYSLEDTPTNNKIKDSMEEDYMYNILPDKGDFFNNKNGSREFITQPCTKFPDDRETFTNWCFKNTSSCKLASIDCTLFEDLKNQPHGLNYQQNVL